MKSQPRSAGPAISVRLPPPVRDRVIRLAQAEHRSAAAYIEQLVERDLRERDEAERIIRVHVADGLPDSPAGDVTQEKGESAARHASRSATLNRLFGAS